MDGVLGWVDPTTGGGGRQREMRAKMDLPFPGHSAKVRQMKIGRHLLLPLCLLTWGCHSPRPAAELQDIRKYQVAATRGDASAQYHLGEAYASHLRFSEADLWYLRAARQGVPEAQYAIGENYYNGTGVPQNPVEAYAWFTVAGTQANIPAHNARENLAVRLTRAELDAGERRAAELLSMIPAEKLIYGQTWTAAEQADKDRQQTVRDYVVAGAVVGGVGGGVVAGTVATAATHDYGADTLHPARPSKGAIDQTTWRSEKPSEKPSPAAAPAPQPAAAQPAAPVFQPATTNP
jgi:Sel1 repeat